MAASQKDAETLGVCRLNELDIHQCIQELQVCCHSQRWAERMAHSRPFNKATIDNVAKDIWWSLDTSDWLEAFLGHPMIGEQGLREKFKTTATLSTQEQSGIHGASEEVLNELANLNKEYHSKFGFIFLVCATGKTASEMLGIMKARIHNHKADELRIAAAEQSKITTLRLKGKLATDLRSSY